ncbi:MAG: hypothetical protein ACOYLT_10100 [Flavobacterium sp.]|uniref:hypothetical protein n=1 Tax=Flavobacterium sp. TaxID=239 RepID=UPI003BED8FCF
MEFFEQLDRFYIQFGLLLVFAIGYFFVQRKNNFKLMLHYLLFVYGIAIMLLSLTIPHVFSGFPYDVSDLENKKRLLYHLQRNNEALVQTTEAFRELVFITFMILVTVIAKIIKHFKIDNSVE